MTAHAHLCKDAAHRPHVNGGGVVSRAQENLRCSVPQRHDLSRKFRVIHIASRSLRATCTNLMRICPHGNAERASEPEVGELEVVIFIDQKILRLEVAVEDAMRVTVEQARRELVGEFLRRRVSTLVHSGRCYLHANACSTRTTLSRDSCDIHVRLAVTVLWTRCDATEDTLTRQTRVKKR